MPVVQRDQHKEMPPVVRMPKEVHLAGHPAFGDATQVDQKGGGADHVHHDHARNEQLETTKGIVYKCK